MVVGVKCDELASHVPEEGNEWFFFFRQACSE